MKTAEEMAQRIAEREAASVASMAERISQREAAITAAGGQGWKWQLRDKNGKWIKMGSNVSWFANGETRLGKVVGSPKEGTAEVEEGSTGRRLRVQANRLAVTGADGGPNQKVISNKGSVPEPNTTPAPSAKATLRSSKSDPETEMPQDQIDRLSAGVKWKVPSSSDKDKDAFYKDGFSRIKDFRNPDGSVRPGRVDGAGTKEDPIYVGSDVAKARELLLEGKHIRMRSQQDITSVLTKDFVAEMKKKNVKTFNMCLVTVPGTNLFCGEDKGIIRKLMPQAAGNDKDTGIKKDVQPWVEELYDELEMISPVESVDAETLKASQSELDGTQVIGMTDGAETFVNMTIAAENLRKAGKTAEADALIAERDARDADKKDFGVMSLDVLTEAILVTDDGYIIDGHHRWAALMVLNERLKENGLEPIQMQVRRVKQEIGEALKTVNELADAVNIAKKSAGGADDVVEEPEVLKKAKANPQVEAHKAAWAARVLKELGPADAEKWKSISEAKKKAVRAKAMKASADMVVPGSVILMPDDTRREVLRVIAETSGGRTFLERDQDTGDLSLSILASAAPVLLLAG